jgi:DNA-binding Lrp family transcriptional regulator
VDEKDRDILSRLATNARMGYSEISMKCGLSPGAVRYRIVRLIERGIITGFRAFIELPRLGYTGYKVELKLDSLDEKDDIRKFLLKSPSISNLIRTAGMADIEACVCTKSKKEFHSFMGRLKDHFLSIRDYELLELPQEYKTNYMPCF